MKRPIALIAVLLSLMLMQSQVFPQMPPPSVLEPGVSQELAKWRAERYSDVRYKLNLTLEKMSPVLIGSIEIRLKVSKPEAIATGRSAQAETRPVGSVPSNTPIILDWRKIRGHEERSTITNVVINGKNAVLENHPVGEAPPPLLGKEGSFVYSEHNEHLIFRDGIVAGENVIKLDFTSPILTSGSAITRYIDKEDGSEYIYSLFVPSDASTAFPVFDQPDLKATFDLFIDAPKDWNGVSNTSPNPNDWRKNVTSSYREEAKRLAKYQASRNFVYFHETQPISTYVFAFAAGPFERVSASVSSPHVSKGSTQPETTGGNPIGSEGVSSTSNNNTLPTGRVSANQSKGGNPSSSEGGINAENQNSTQKNPVAIAPGSDLATSIYVRKSQAEKLKPHAAEVFRLNRESVKFFEEYFDYKFPFPKYDLVLIPEFPFGGMEHAGATFLRESSIIFPQEPTRNDHISRAVLIFHEAAHQWFGDTVTMKWFDDLWLKEGFANFAAYKALEKIMPEANAWKVFYERIKQAAYATDSTKGTTAIYQPIDNLSSAKSAYGNIVYNKAPAFLRQAEFYLGEDKIQAAVRSFLKKHEFKNATWNDLVDEFANAKIAETKATEHYKGLSDGDKKELLEFSYWSITKEWAEFWVHKRGLAVYRTSEKLFDNKWGLEWQLNFGSIGGHTFFYESFTQTSAIEQENYNWLQDVNVIKAYENSYREEGKARIGARRYAYLPDQAAKPRQSYTFSEETAELRKEREAAAKKRRSRSTSFVFPNYGDYGYGIFLLDEKSRDYVLKNIQNEKDPFLRSMMWGALWDSVREGELDPREYVELVVKVLSSAKTENHPVGKTPTPLLSKEGCLSGEDESTTALLLNRVATAMNYYIDTKGGNPNGSEGVSSTSNKNTLPTGRVSANQTKGGNPSSSEGEKNAEQRSTLPTGRVSATEDSLRTRVEDMLAERLQYAPTQGQRITYYRAFLNIAASEKARGVLKEIFSGDLGEAGSNTKMRAGTATIGGKVVHAGKPAIPVATKDKFDIVTRLLILGDPSAENMLAELERSYTTDDAKRYAYAARAGLATAENKAKYWKDFTQNKDISESWIEAAFGPWNSNRHSQLTLPYLQRALQELPNHKRNRKIFFVNGWLGSFIGGQRSEEALNIINKFLADNPALDNDLRLKILENSDVIERSVKIRKQFPANK